MVGFESLYEVSECGLVRRIGKAHKSGMGRSGGARIGRILAPQRHSGGYLASQLWKFGKLHRKLIHCLVAQAYIGPVPDGKEVNHIDGVKSNNHVMNLEYLTRSENNFHAYRTGLKHAATSHGENHGGSKLTCKQVNEIRALYVPRIFGGPKLAELFGVNHTTIYRILKGVIWNQNNQNQKH